jgi:hypothetical protein
MAGGGPWQATSGKIARMAERGLQRPVAGRPRKNAKYSA